MDISLGTSRKPEPRRATYQISTDAGYVCIQMPFSMSLPDAGDVAKAFELITRQMMRRSFIPGEAIITDGEGNEWSNLCPECGAATMQVVRVGKIRCFDCTPD